MERTRHSRRERLRWLERALPAVGVAVVVLLLLTQLIAYLGVRRAAQATSRGQAQAVVHDVARAVVALDHVPTRADLQTLLADRSSTGLRYVAILHPGATVRAGTAELADPRHFSRVVYGHDRVAMTRRLFHHHAHHRAGHRAMPNRGAAGGVGSTYGGHRHWRRSRLWGLEPPAPRLVVEVEPVIAGALQAQAKRTLALGVLTTVLVLALAVGFRRVAAQRAQLRVQAERDRRLASLGAMSSILAHEIRNPLTSLKGHAQLLLESLPEDAPDRANAARVVNEAKRLETLTGDLLSFVRTGKLAPSEVDPVALVKEAVETVDAERFVLTTDEAPDRFRLDAERIREVLVNLLRNAAQASPRPADVAVERAGDYLAIEVRDRGNGIPPGELERVFEPFHTTRVRGTGLGLAVARHIVAAHGGHIAATNHPEGGAVFRVVLPPEPPAGDA